MSSHISYHPIGTDVIRQYVAYLSDPLAAARAGADYDATMAHERFRQAYVDMADGARSLAGVFDESHGLNLAVTQGFFGTYHYVHDGRLSALGDVLDPYTSTWQELIPGWEATTTARNRLGDTPSSGVFVSAHHVSEFMHDAHNSAELQAALGAEFSADELLVLWAALTAAHESGVGLLEASGVIEPNASDIAQSSCLTNQTNCDPTGLRLYLAAAGATEAPPSPSAPPPPSAPQAPAPPRRRPSAPSLAERLRAKTEEP